MLRLYFFIMMVKLARVEFSGSLPKPRRFNNADGRLYLFNARVIRRVGFRGLH